MNTIEEQEANLYDEQHGKCAICHAHEVNTDGPLRPEYIDRSTVTALLCPSCADLLDAAQESADNANSSITEILRKATDFARKCDYGL